MASYRYLLTKTAAQYRIVLYNGDWDAVVPYIDTIKNLRKLNLIENEDLYVFSKAANPGSRTASTPGSSKRSRACSS